MENPLTWESNGFSRDFQGLLVTKCSGKNPQGFLNIFTPKMLIISPVNLVMTVLGILTSVCSGWVATDLHAEALGQVKETVFTHSRTMKGGIEA